MGGFFHKNKYPIIFALLGVIIGYVYWYYKGCSSGTCIITSTWHNSSIYGLIMGGLLGSSLKDIITKRKKNKDLK
ncbi:hypothetical protein EYV94_14225 [Puteibacter caeruleilacunae]|nr:hypothetical protein EYV94_14225 [Puteibacter caeruleilacunae]